MNTQIARSYTSHVLIEHPSYYDGLWWPAPLIGQLFMSETESMEASPHILGWLEQRWTNANWAARVFLIIIAIPVIGVVAFELGSMPGFDRVKELYAASPPGVQFGILLAALIGIVVSLVFARSRHVKADLLKEERRRLEDQLAAAQAEIRLNQTRMDHLLDVESRMGIWQRSPVVMTPTFVPPSQRGTRFLTVLNLKGGVGKTTLTANLAALFATGTDPKRVLLIDVDFQGTLGDATVDRSLAIVQGQHGAFVNRLLLSIDESEQLVSKLTLPMGQVPKAKVILASDTLDTDEFHLQAKYFLEQSADPRFRFRSHLHHPAVFSDFDLVIFDCPPRVTVSVVNAVACSDYVLIPTRLDRGSIDAVPRTLIWLKSLGPTFPGTVLGVVASHASIRDRKLVRSDAESYEYLREVVNSQCGTDKLFRQVIPSSPRAVAPQPGVVAGLSPEGRAVFQPFVTELSERLFQ